MVETSVLCGAASPPGEEIKKNQEEEMAREAQKTVLLRTNLRATLRELGEGVGNGKREHNNLRAKYDELKKSVIERRRENENLKKPMVEMRTGNVLLTEAVQREVNRYAEAMAGGLKGR